MNSAKILKAIQDITGIRTKKKLRLILVLVLLINICLGIGYGLMNWVIWGATTTADRLAVLMGFIAAFLYSTLVYPLLIGNRPQQLNQKKSSEATEWNATPQETDHP